EQVWFASYSSDRLQIIAGRSDGQMMIWDAQTQTLQQSIQADEDSVWFAGFAGDTGMLVSGGSSVRIWSEDSGKLEYELAVPDGLRYVNTTNSNVIITMHDPDEDWTGGVILWDVTTGKEIQRFETDYPPDYVILSSDGAYL